MGTPPDDVDTRLHALLDGGAIDLAATLLIERYGRELGAYLMALASSPDLAADAYAQLCEDLWRGLPGFAFRASARTWLYTLARHALARQARDPRRRRDRNQPLSAAAHAEKAAAELRAETAAYRRTTMKDRVRALREQLSADERELLLLRVDRELDWADIARILAEGELSDAERRKRSAALRKRFERLKERLRTLAIEQGLLSREGERA